MSDVAATLSASRRALRHRQMVANSHSATKMRGSASGYLPMACHRLDPRQPVEMSRPSTNRHTQQRPDDPPKANHPDCTLKKPAWK
ncbi:MAG: hypothetical protein R3D28_03850 [Geminicoccaceae bacterium]